SFLDIKPFAEGHTLVIPRNHVELFSELDEHSLTSLFITASEVARLLKQKLRVEGINVLVNEGKVAGQVVPHVHIHLIPRKPGDEPIYTQRVQAERSILESIKNRITEGK
ncbi:MAG: HIT family protein, partial [Nitrososphaerales archaeon]